MYMYMCVYKNVPFKYTPQWISMVYLSASPHVHLSDLSLIMYAGYGPPHSPGPIFLGTWKSCRGRSARHTRRWYPEVLEFRQVASGKWQDVEDNS